MRPTHCVRTGCTRAIKAATPGRANRGRHARSVGGGGNVGRRQHTKPDVVVRVRRAVVQVRREHARVSVIVPVAPTDDSTRETR